MASKYLNSLSEIEYEQLTEKLRQIQNSTCYICQDLISPAIQVTNIDHIIPLANKGTDDEQNFALTHESCNKSKQDADLNIARILHRLKRVQDDTMQKEGKPASLKHVLQLYGGSKHNLQFSQAEDKIQYSFSEVGDNNIYEAEIFLDKVSGERTCFIAMPLEYVYHDELINPRAINSSISKLVKEFAKGNPQLHLTLGRIDNGKVKVFDGQHKAVAQILLGTKKILLRIFLSPNLDRLTETNTNAGSTLRQIAFDKSVMRQLNNTLYSERIKQYQKDHKLKEDDFSFSEQQLAAYFKADNSNVKKYIIDSIKHSITESNDNKLKDYIDREGKAKDLPISYSAFDKSFLTLFIDGKQLLSTPINHKTDEGLNPRELEIAQLIKLLNIIADEIYIGKFVPEIGVNKIENKILERKDGDVTDHHLIAFRLSKEEIMFNWLGYITEVINNYFSNTGKRFNKSSMFQQKFDDQLWTNIQNFIVNIKSLPLWKDRSMAGTIFSGKRNYDYWKHILETGKTTDNVQALAKPVNYVEMIKGVTEE